MGTRYCTRPGTGFHQPRLPPRAEASLALRGSRGACGAVERWWSLCWANDGEHIRVSDPQREVIAFSCEGWQRKGGSPRTLVLSPTCLQRVIVCCEKKKTAVGAVHRASPSPSSPLYPRFCLRLRWTWKQVVPGEGESLFPPRDRHPYSSCMFLCRVVSSLAFAPAARGLFHPSHLSQKAPSPVQQI